MTKGTVLSCHERGRNECVISEKGVSCLTGGSKEHSISGDAPGNAPSDRLGSNWRAARFATTWVVAKLRVRTWLPLSINMLSTTEIVMRARIRDQLQVAYESLRSLSGYLPTKHPWHARPLHSNPHIRQPPLRVMHLIHWTDWASSHPIGLPLLWWGRRTMHCQVICSQILPIAIARC